MTEKTAMSSLLLSLFLFLSPSVSAQDKSGGGVQQEEVLIVDKDNDYIINEDLTKIPKDQLKWRMRKFTEKVDEFLAEASAELSTCRKKPVEFKTMKSFHLYLVATDAVHITTTTSFLPQVNVDCKNRDDKTDEAKKQKADVCIISTPTTKKLRELVESKRFRDYLAQVEGIHSEGEASLMIKYFKELYR